MDLCIDVTGEPTIVTPTERLVRTHRRFEAGVSMVLTRLAPRLFPRERAVGQESDEVSFAGVVMHDR